MDVTFITIEKLLEMKENKTPHTLVEVLSESAFTTGHIPDAINIPLEELEERAPDMIDTDETVVVYCADYACHASTKAARKLQDMGHTNVLDYKAGKKGWEDGGLKLKQ